MFKHVPIINKSAHSFNDHIYVSECDTIDIELGKQKTQFYQGTAHEQERQLKTLRLLDEMLQLPFTLLVSGRQDKVPSHVTRYDDESFRLITLLAMTSQLYKNNLGSTI